MSNEVALDTGQLFAELGKQLRQNAMVALIALALLVVGNLAIDQLGKSSALPAGFLSLAVQLYVIRAALKKADLLPDGSKERFRTFWWMSIISSLAIAGGCVLLIIPGLYLGARWFLAGPIVIAEDKTAVEALRESWHRTRASVWHLAGATLVVFGGAFAFAIVPNLIAPESMHGISLDAATYVLMFSACICAWLLEVGVYGLISDRSHVLSEVFA